MTQPLPSAPDPCQEHGLHRDLRTILNRRQALMLAAASGGTALLSSCGLGGPPSNPQPDILGMSADGVECVAHPEETQGPYPADGSNRAHGELANVLDDIGIVREDIRSGLTSGSLTVEGTALELTLSLIDVRGACVPLVGHAVYLWHCDAAGKYSLYDLKNETFLRGVGVADHAGQIRFKTIVPGCYDGRFPHIHFEVYPSLDKATDYTNRILTSQIAVPAKLCRRVYGANPAYVGSLKNLKRSPLEDDNVFADNTPKQLAAQTMKYRTTDAGVAGSVVIGVATRAA
ncbi:MAG: hypothetical protein MRY74_16455 [Neomegalonema sp.]|nr:hypothetical protein [Neomegalonema sp.]